MMTAEQIKKVRNDQVAYRSKHDGVKAEIREALKNNPSRYAVLCNLTAPNQESLEIYHQIIALEPDIETLIVTLAWLQLGEFGLSILDETLEEVELNDKSS